MKAKWYREVDDTLKRSDFLAWWAELSDVLRGQKEARERQEELLTQESLISFRAELAQKNAIDMLYRAGEHEDAAAKLAAEVSELESRSYEAEANFESQRILVSDLWSKLSSQEKALEDKRKALAEAMSGREPGAEIKRRENELSRLEKELQRIREDYEKNSARKNRLGEEVELIWTKSLENNLSMAEKKRRGQRVRREAERLFQVAEENKVKAQRMREEAVEAGRKMEELESKARDLYVQARQRFDCIVDEDYLYWQQRENSKMAYCVPLLNDSEGCDFEVKTLGIYQADQQHGVDSIEPVAKGGAFTEEEDTRIDEFFTVGRKTRPRHAKAAN